MPSTSPPTIAPATSTAPTETHQRMAALPSFHEDGDTQNASRKAETCNCRSSSGGPLYFSNVTYWHETDMPTLLRDVRFQGQNGKHVLSLSFSGFDPSATSGLISF